MTEESVWENLTVADVVSWLQIGGFSVEAQICQDKFYILFYF